MVIFCPTILARTAVSLLDLSIKAPMEELPKMPAIVSISPKSDGGSRVSGNRLRRKTTEENSHMRSPQAAKKYTQHIRTEDVPACDSCDPRFSDTFLSSSLLSRLSCCPSQLPL